MTKITLKLVRSFSIGFSIFSPTLNGFYVTISVGCISLDVWSRGKGLFSFKNFWNS